MSEVQQVGPEVINTTTKGESPIKTTSENGTSFLRIKQSLAVLRDQAKNNPGEVIKSFLFNTNNEEARDAVLKLRWELGGRERFKKMCVSGGHDGDKAALVVDYLMGNLSSEKTETSGSDETVDQVLHKKRNFHYYSIYDDSYIKLSEVSDNPVALLDQLMVLFDANRVSVDGLANYADLVASDPRFGELVDKIGRFPGISNAHRSLYQYDITVTNDDGGERSVEFWGRNGRDSVYELLHSKNQGYERLTSNENFSKALSLWAEVKGEEPLPVDYLVGMLEVASDGDLSRLFQCYVRQNDRFVEDWGKRFYQNDFNETVERLKSWLVEKPELLQLDRWGIDIGFYLKKINLPELLEDVVATYKKVADNPRIQQNARILNEFGLKMSFETSGFYEGQLVDSLTSFAMDSDPDRLRKALTIASLAVKPINGDSLESWQARYETEEIWKVLDESLTEVSLEEVVEAFTLLGPQMEQLKKLELEITTVLIGVKSGEDLKKRVEAALSPEIQVMVSDYEFRNLVFGRNMAWEAWQAFLTDPDVYKELYQHKEVLGQNIALLLKTAPRLEGRLMRMPDLFAELATCSAKEIMPLARELDENHVNISEDIVRKARLLMTVSADEKEQLLAFLNHSSFLTTLYDEQIILEDLESYFGLSAKLQQEVWVFYQELKDKYDFSLSYTSWGGRDVRVSLGFCIDLVVDPEKKARLDAFMSQNEVASWKKSVILNSYVGLIERHEFESDFLLEAYVTDSGSPTQLFLGDLASLPEGRGYEQLSTLLSDRLLESMEIHEKNYWEFWRKYDFKSIHDFVGEDVGRFHQLVADKEVTVDFLDAFVEWGKQHNKDLYRLFREDSVDYSSSFSTSYKEIMSEEVLAQMSDEDRPFWKLMHNSIDVGDKDLFNFVLDNRDRTSNWIEQGVLKESFFDDYVASRDVFENYSGLWSLITDEVLAGMSAEGKEFWEFVRNTQINSVRRFIFQNRIQFSDYVAEGKATVQLLDNLVGLKELEDSGLQSLLSDELIEGMAEEKKKFWELFRLEPKLSSHLRAFPYQHVDGFVAMEQSMLGKALIEIGALNLAYSSEELRSRFWELGESFSNEELGNYMSFFLKERTSVAVDLLAYFNPKYRRLLTDPTKLSTISTVLKQQIGKIVESDASADLQDKMRQVYKLLEKIYVVTESSDSTIVDKRSVFLSSYSINETSDLIFHQKYQQLVDGGMDAESAFVELARSDFEELLIQSGNRELELHYQNVLSHTDTTSETRELLMSKLWRLREIREKTDEYNREVHQAYETAFSNKEKIDIVLPIEDSISQVGPHYVSRSGLNIANIGGMESISSLIFNSATLPDALLGQDSVRQELNCMSHVATTRLIKDVELTETLEDRLPSYGNPHGHTVTRVYTRIGGMAYKPVGKNGDRDGASGTMGSAHQFVHGGIANQHISTIVLHDEGATDSVKQAIARNGWYVLVLNEEGEVLLDPKEFDELRALCRPLELSGYPLGVINGVENYYHQLKNDYKGKEKHWQVMLKAVEQIKTDISNSRETTVDLAVLVNFLKNNDLNTHEVEWYERQDFATILSEIDKNVAEKLRWKARSLLFEEYEQEDGHFEPQKRRFDEINKLTRKQHVFIDSLFDKQLEFIFETPDGDEEVNRAKEDWINQGKSHLRKVLFPLPDQNVSQMTAFNSDFEASRYLTETKNMFMRKLWSQACNEVVHAESNEERQNHYRWAESLLVPVVTGSGGRGEVSLASDLDYAILVDDTLLTEVEVGLLKNFVNDVLAPRMNSLLTEHGIRADAGLAKKDRQPFSLLLTYSRLKIEVGAQRQDEEPTELFSYEPLFEENEEMIKIARTAFFSNLSVKNNLVSFLEYDLYDKLGNPSVQIHKTNNFVRNFEAMFNSLTGGGSVKQIKESFQRTIIFKLYHLAAQAMSNGQLSDQDLISMPTRSVELVDWLRDKGIISGFEANICHRSLASAYKLRLLAELYSSESQGNGGKGDGDLAPKVREHTFRLEDISYSERSKVFQAVKDFRYEMLYKLLPVT
jgi:hypothetical protein